MVKEAYTQQLLIHTMERFEPSNEELGSEVRLVNYYVVPTFVSVEFPCRSKAYWRLGKMNAEHGREFDLTVPTTSAAGASLSLCAAIRRLGKGLLLPVNYFAVMTIMRLLST